MNNEYIIINKTSIQKRIEEWESKYGNEDIESSSEAHILLKQILSQSTPLIPEIENAFDSGQKYGEDNACNAEIDLHNNKQNYISNLKLSI